MNKLKLASVVPLISLPIVVVSSCSTPINNEVALFLNSLKDSEAKETFTTEEAAQKHAAAFAKTIINSSAKIPENIVNASIFTNYPLTQQIGQGQVMQMEPLSAKSEGTKIILTVRVAYSYNDNLNVKNYTENKNLVVEFFVPTPPTPTK